MADISIISRLVQGFQRNVDISQNSLVVGSLKVGSASPTELTKAILDKLILIHNQADADGTYDTRYNTKTLLASTATGEGASLVGIEDAGTYFTGNTVEEALQQLGAAAGGGSASDITYDNVASGLTATNVQDAIDEVEGRLDATEIVANAAIPAAEKGAADGVAPLGPDSKVPAIYLPSYVDDVLEFADLASFPVTGETGKIYLALDTEKAYRWSGSMYIEVSPSDVNSVNGQTGIVTLTTDNIVEGGSNLYFTDERAQDAVAAALVDSDTIDFDYNDTTPSITAIVKDNSITEDKLTTGVADQVTITGGNGAALAVQEAPVLARTMIVGEALADDETFAMRLAVDGETATRIYKADNDATTLNNFFVIGLARKVGGASAADPIRLVQAGPFTLGANDTPFNAADIGKPVYLGAAGALTITAPVTANLAAFRIGILESTTVINVDRQLHGIN